MEQQKRKRSLAMFAGLCLCLFGAWQTVMFFATIGAQTSVPILYIVPALLGAGIGAALLLNQELLLCVFSGAWTLYALVNCLISLGSIAENWWSFIINALCLLVFCAFLCCNLVLLGDKFVQSKFAKVCISLLLILDALILIIQIVDLLLSVMMSDKNLILQDMASLFAYFGILLAGLYLKSHFSKEEMQTHDGVICLSVGILMCFTGIVLRFVTDWGIGLDMYDEKLHEMFLQNHFLLAGGIAFFIIVGSIMTIMGIVRLIGAIRNGKRIVQEN